MYICSVQITPSFETLTIYHSINRLHFSTPTLTLNRFFSTVESVIVLHSIKLSTPPRLVAWWNSFSLLGSRLARSLAFHSDSKDWTKSSAHLLPQPFHILRLETCVLYLCQNRFDSSPHQIMRGQFRQCGLSMRRPAHRLSEWQIHSVSSLGAPEYANL